MRLTSLIAVLLVSLVACGRSDDTALPDGQGSGSNDGSVKIQDVQNDSMSPGTAVSLANVVVTAVDNFGAKTGDLWVEEMGGGKRSGVHVFTKGMTPAGLAVGDVVNIKGAIKSEFALTGSNADKSGRTTTELEAATAGSLVITKTGQSATITPDKVDALAIGQMYDSTMSMLGGGAAFSNAWEEWEGVLVELDNVAAASGPKGFGGVGIPPVYPPDNYSFGITGVAKAEGTMVDVTMSSIARATCFSSMTGVVDYFYDYLVLPRSSADFATGGTGCPQAESVCTDGKDNDGNGFTDCADNGCIVNSDSCHVVSTIAALDAAADANPAAPTLPTGGLKIAAACVTAIVGTDVYIAAAGTAAADGGLFVFSAGQTLPTGVAVGSLVDVVGTATSFKRSSSTAPEGTLELNELGMVAAAGSCTVAATNPAMTAAQMATDATGHKWVGSLVTLTNANGGQYKVSTKAALGFGQLTQGTTVFKFSTALLSTFGAATTECYDSMTGIWTYDTFGAGSYEFVPTSATTATCS